MKRFFDEATARFQPGLLAKSVVNGTSFYVGVNLSGEGHTKVQSIIPALSQPIGVVIALLYTMEKQSKSEQYYNEWYFTRYPNYSAYEQLTDKQKLAMHKGVGFNLWKMANSVANFQSRFWESIGKLSGKK